MGVSANRDQDQRGLEEEDDDGLRDGKTCRYCRYICAIFSLAVLICSLYTRKIALKIVLLALC